MIIEQKSITKAIVLIVVACLTMGSCASDVILPTQNSHSLSAEEQQEAPTLAVTQPTEVPTVSTTHPIEAESTNRYATIPYDLLPYVREAIEYDISLNDFAAMFGEESIRRTGTLNYSVVSLRNGLKKFIIFDLDGSVYYTKVMSDYISEKVFLDCIQGNRVTLKELAQLTPNYLWEYSSRAYANFYVQEGVFVLLFEMDINPQGEREFYLKEVVSFYTNQEVESLCANDYRGSVKFIFPEDRRNN